ncbi:hypothetical protein HaLaN_10613 [Haematococcus lacustris]|uniref:Uncharacterized protein n=1 Tax=Haematococcus lacustris TaxID=44745 RepID=A0A699YWC4_HAELA|nr:hypothetical protein HaLaN_10613 [Haematococcus lacustris]
MARSSTTSVIISAALLAGRCPSASAVLRSALRHMVASSPQQQRAPLQPRSYGFRLSNVWRASQGSQQRLLAVAAAQAGLNPQLQRAVRQLQQGAPRAQSQQSKPLSSLFGSCIPGPPAWRCHLASIAPRRVQHCPLTATFVAPAAATPAEAPNVTIAIQLFRLANVTMQNTTILAPTDDVGITALCPHATRHCCSMACPH